MDIEFENAKARQIYDRVLNNASSVAKEKAKELFTLAAEADFNDKTLSEEEAKSAEEALKRYDKGLLNQLNITFYAADEVGAALAEFKAWNACFEYKSAAEYIEKLKAFIKIHPDSPRASRACFNLAEEHEDADQTAEAISMYERLVKNHPQTREAAEALRHLTNLYRMVDDNEKMIACIKKWQKFLPYEPFGHYGPAPKYEEVALEIKLMQAQYYRESGNMEKALCLFKELRTSTNKDIAELADGALNDVRSNLEGEDNSKNYLRYLRSIYCKQAEYFLYEKHDLNRAKALAQKAPNSVDADVRRRGILAEIALRETDSLPQALKIFSELKAKGEINNYFSYLGVKRNLLNDISADIYFLALLLNCYSEVKEVRILSCQKTESANAEIKSPKNYYYLLYRTADGWQLADGGGPCDPDKLGLKQDYIDQIASTSNTIVIENAAIMQQAFKKKLFAGSLKEFHNERTYSATDTVDALEKARLSADEQKTAEWLSFRFGNGHAKNGTILGVTKAYQWFPSYFFDDLKINNVPSFSMANYNPRIKTINFDESETTFPHELAHHWDLGLTRGEYNIDLSHNDLSLTFYSISWLSWSNRSNGAAWGYCKGVRIPQYKKYYDNFKKQCEPDFKPIGWEIRPETNTYAFAELYGMADGFEDFATSFDSYYSARYDRERIRKQMQEGGFYRAVKYLFIKYITMFDPADGLCYEYNLSEDDSPLNFSEVRHAMAQWEKKDPNNKVPEHLKQIIDKIETEYLKRKVQSGYDLG